MRLRRFAILLAPALLLVSACGSTDNKDSSSKTTKPGPVTTVKGTKGSVAAKQVADRLQAAWKAGDKAAAAMVADKAAVDTLFAKAYSGAAQKVYGCGGGKTKGTFTCVYYDDTGGYLYHLQASGKTYRVAKIDIAPKK